MTTISVTRGRLLFSMNGSGSHGTSFVPLVFLAAVLLGFPLAAAAQTPAGPSAKATPPPAGWMEKWVGMWETDPAPRRTLPFGGNPDWGLNELVIPRLQPWANARREATDPEFEDPGQLCKPTGLFLAGSGGAFELLASPDNITLIARGGGGISTGGIRRIYLDRPHWKNPPLTYYGDSAGHWEGDTLVIDTVGFNDQNWLSGDRARHSEALHVVERIRFIDNNSLEHVWTVDDRFALTSPYSFTRFHRRQPPDTPLAENLCQDTPESRRAWLKLRIWAVRDWESNRAAPPPAQ